MYTRLSERLNMNDHLMVLNIMLGKIAVNLKVYSSSEDVIQQTLSLFQARLHSLTNHSIPRSRLSLPPAEALSPAWGICYAICLQHTCWEEDCTLARCILIPPTSHGERRHGAS